MSCNTVDVKKFCRLYRILVVALLLLIKNIL